MSNSFITVKEVARKTLPRLIENLVLPNLCYRDYSDTFSDLGDTIQVRKPVTLEGKDYTSGSVTVQDVTENSVDVKLDKIATVDIKLSAFEAATNWSEQKFMTDFIEPAAVALAQKINKSGIALYKDIPNMLGTIGTTPDGLDDFAKARKFLNAAKAPLSERYAIWDVEADAKFTEIGNLIKVNEAGSPQALREGEIGRVFGLDNYMCQSIEKVSSTATGTILIDGAATAGADMIHVDGVTKAICQGDCFTIAGDTTVYTVTKAGSLETNDQDVYISPKLAANAADNAAVTLKTDVTNNLIFHKNAIAFVTRPLHAPAGVESYTTNGNGFSLRVVRGYDIDTKTEKMSMDVLYGYKVVMPELAARYFG